jgi:serine/threonine protein kinase
MSRKGASMLNPGDTVRGGRYEIARSLRGGADKQVYLARDHEFDVLVALDVFLHDASSSAGLNPSVWEARVLAKLGDHRNIGSVLDRWDDNDTSFMVSRYLPGGSLRERITSHRERGTHLSANEIIRCASDIAHGLAHIHTHGYVYRDLQPHNVLFDEAGAVRLVDFDTACAIDDPSMSDISDREVVAYMAPEQLAGNRVDERADLYALGATNYEMCTGTVPFDGDREAILRAHRTGGSVTLERSDLPEGLRELTLALLASDRDDRPANARTVIDMLVLLQSERADLEALLRSDESADIEFKTSLRVPVGDPQLDRLTKNEAKQRELDLEKAVTKTIAAFLNTDGGTLVIGRADDGAVVGIEIDFPRAKDPSRDGWRRTFDDVITRDLGPEVMSALHVQLNPYEGQTVAVVRCEPRHEPTWFRDEVLFVRRTASTMELSPKQTLTWCREHFEHENS